MTVTPGLGTLLKMGDGAMSEAFTTIGQRTEITGPSLEMRTKETTHLDSAQAEFRATLMGGGELGLPIQSAPAAPQHAALLARIKLKTVNNYKLIFADAGAAEILFAAILTKFEP